MPCSDLVHKARWSSQDPGRWTPPHTPQGSSCPSVSCQAHCPHRPQLAMLVTLVLSPKAQNVTSRGVLTTSGGRTEVGPCGKLCSRVFGGGLGLQSPLCPAHQVTGTGCDHSEGCQLLISTEILRRLLVALDRWRLWVGAEGAWDLSHHPAAAGNS